MGRVTNKLRHVKNVLTGRRRRQHNNGPKRHRATGAAKATARKPKHGVKRVVGGVKHGVKRVVGGVKHVLHKITHPRSHGRRRHNHAT